MEFQVLMRRSRHLLLLALATISLQACNMEQEIGIDIQPPVDTYVVECYLEPDSTMRLSLTRPLPLLDVPTLENLTVSNATVVIRQGGNTYPLTFFGPDSSNYYLAGEYRSALPCPNVPGQSFSLEINIPEGGSVRTLTATTLLLPKVEMNGIRTEVIRQEGKDFRALLAEWNDPNTGIENWFYFSVQHPRDPDSTIAYTTTDARNGGQAIDDTGAPPWWLQGDTLTIRFAHVTPEYYRFEQSVDRAADGNGNPFVEPGSIQSNINGGIGIFTAFYLQKLQYIVP